MRLRFLFILSFIAITAMAQKRSISILGDSYSTFQEYTTPQTNEQWYFTKCRTELTDVTDVTQTWWHLLCQKEGFKLDTNNSYSGATICFTGYGGNDFTDRSFITRASNLGCPDIIFVLGGTNDSWANSPMGNMKYEAFEKGDLYNYRPAVCYLAKYLSKRYPNTLIYFILNNELKPEIGAAMKEACIRYRLGFIELKDISKKAGHPDIKGMKQIADQVSEALKKEIKW